MISYYYLIFLFFYKNCSHTELVANGVCNDESNNTDCHFDGGDCTANISTTTQATTSGTGGSTTGTMAIPVVEFSKEGFKIRKIFWLKSNCSQMKLPNFENWSSGELSKSAQI